MRAATIRDGEIVVAEHPDPVPGAGEILVRVAAAGLNAADIQQAAGRTGALCVPVAATFPLGDAAAEYERFAAGSKLGKMILTNG